MVLARLLCVPRSSDSFYIVSYCIKLVTISWTYSMISSVHLFTLIRIGTLNVCKNFHFSNRAFDRAPHINHLIYNPASRLDFQEILRQKITMVLILGGNSEIGAHSRRSLCYLICLRHLIRSRVTNRIFFFRKDFIFMF